MRRINLMINILLSILIAASLFWIDSIKPDVKTYRCQAKSIDVRKTDDYIPGSVIRTYIVNCPDAATRAVARSELTAFDEKTELTFKRQQSQFIEPQTELIIASIILVMMISMMIRLNYGILKNAVCKTMD